MTTLVEHDWSAYNRYIEQQARAVGVDIHEPLAPVDWWERAKAIALVTVAAGLAITLALWGWQRARTEPGLVEQLTRTVAEAAPQPTPVLNGFPAVPEKPVVTTAPPEGETIRNYVIFTTRTLPGVGAVKTGWQFADNSATKPYLQWCYLEPDRLRRDGAAITIDLPRIGRPQLSDNALSRYELNRDQVARAEALCAWSEQSR